MLHEADALEMMGLVSCLAAYKMPRVDYHVQFV